MVKSHLIQRLRKPYKRDADNPLSRLADSFAFGGGFVNGGLSKEAMNVLSEIFRFDYMGAAEYEFGAVPEAFQKVVENINDSKTPGYVRTTMHINKMKGVKNSQNVDIHIICREDWVPDVKTLINLFVEDEYGKQTPHIKRGVHLRQCIDSPSEYNKDQVGWFELDNGFFFFIDKEMADKVAQLFEVTKEV